MKKLVVVLIGLLAVFTFIRDYSGSESASSAQAQAKTPIVKAQIQP